LLVLSGIEPATLDHGVLLEALQLQVYEDYVLCNFSIVGITFKTTNSALLFCKKSTPTKAIHAASAVLWSEDTM